MVRSVFTKDLWDHRRSMVWWIVGMVALTALLAAFFPVVRDSPEMQEFLARVPAEILAMFGIDTDLFLSGAGFLQAQLYSFVGPIIVITFAIITGTAATAREEADGTMDMLLSAPLSRPLIVVQKAASLAILSLLIVGSIGLTLLALNAPLELRLEIDGVIAVTIGLWLLGLTFGSISMLVGAWTGAPSVSSGVAAGLAIVAWFANAFVSLFSWLEVPSQLSPFSWYLDDLPLVTGLSTGHYWLGLATVVLVAGAAWLFRRRDIATERPVLPETKLGEMSPKTRSPRATALLTSVYGKTVWNRRISVWVWALGLSSLSFLTFAAWPALAGDPAALEGLVSALPREMLALFGLTPAAPGLRVVADLWKRGPNRDNRLRHRLDDVSLRPRRGVGCSR